MKKKLGLLALTAMMAVSMSACGSKSEGTAGGSAQTGNGNASAGEPAAGNATEELKPEPGAELTLWTKKDDFVVQSIAEFEKKYNVKVKLEDVFYTETVDRLKTDGPAGMGADLIVFGHDRLGDAVKSGIVLPNDYFEEDAKAANIQTAVDALTYDGIMYGYPQYLYTYALYVNDDLVKGAKLDTWDDVKAVAKTITDVKNNKYGFMFEGAGASLFYDYSFMAGYGGYVFGKNGTDKNDIGVNNEGAVKGMQFFQSLKDILPLKLTDLTRDVKDGLWQDGKVAINMDGSWSAGPAKKLPFKVRVVPLPVMSEGKSPIAFAGVSGYFVTAYTKYPNAAKLLAHYLTTKEAQIKNYQMTGVIPVASGLDETNEIFKDDPIMQGFMKQIKNTQHMPSIPEMNYFWENVTPALEQIWNGADVKATLDKAANNMKNNIAASK